MSQTACDELRWCLAQARAPRLRSMREFAEQEIVLPRSSPFADLRFKVERQPFTGIYLDAIDSGLWNRFLAVGPSQSGKTLIGFVVPILYHLFEIGEGVIAGGPDLAMIADKWNDDLLPVIEKTRYRDLLPRSGAGSKGGKSQLIQFENGAWLRWMSSGAKDKGRAGKPSRVLAVTEVEAFGEAGGASEESDKLSQLEARLNAHRKAGTWREYLECTVTTPEGIVWTEYEASTMTRIALPCPHCRRRVIPGREDLHGWQDARDSVEAEERGHFRCPECEAPWSEAQRTTANLHGIAVHRGQELDCEDAIHGPAPRTHTFGLGWTAANNQFATGGNVAAEEWAGRRARNRDKAERRLCQISWGLPYETPEISLTLLDRDELAKRVAAAKRGIVPATAVAITVGVDTHKRFLAWTAIAWQTDSTGRVIDYGLHYPVDSGRLGMTKALAKALNGLRDYWVWKTENGEARGPDQVWIDSGYHEHTEAVYAWCIAANDAEEIERGKERYRPSKGYGEGRQFSGRYPAPTKVSKEIRLIGNQFHLSWLQEQQIALVHVNADYWKADFHGRLGRADDEPGAIVLFEGPPGEHDEWIDEVTAEEQQEVEEKGRSRIRWVPIRRKNHQLDAGYAAVAAGDYCLGLLAQEAEPKKKWWAGRGRRRGRR